MKITSTAVQLIVTAIIAGVLTYFTTKSFTKFYWELLPILAFLFLCLSFFLRRLLDKYSRTETLVILAVSLIVLFVTYYIIAEFFPLNGMKPISVSEHSLRLFSFTGISFLLAATMWIIATILFKGTVNTPLASQDNNP